MGSHPYGEKSEELLLIKKKQFIEGKKKGESNTKEREPKKSKNGSVVNIKLKEKKRGGKWTDHKKKKELGGEGKKNVGLQGLLG